MNETKTLKEQVKILRAMVTQLAGYDPLAATSDEPKDRPDYVEFGSPRHAAILGLLRIENNDVVDFITFTSPVNGQVYRLEDEVTPFMHYSDPSQVARLVLRQKVSEFEAGAPPVPENAPLMWMPRTLV